MSAETRIEFRYCYDHCAFPAVMNRKAVQLLADGRQIPIFGRHRMVSLPLPEPRPLPAQALERRNPCGIADLGSPSAHRSDHSGTRRRRPLDSSTVRWTNTAKFVS